MTNLSIIIPHYNSINTLKKLLETIPNIQDIQVIVVDDHSDEDNKERYHDIKEENKDRNILFLENLPGKKGAGACRNVGLKHANGQWILFADSDDFFVENFYENVSKYFNSTSDVIFFKPTSIEIDTRKESDRHVPFVELIDNYANSKSRVTEILLRYRFIVPWSKLIKRSVILEHDILFDEVISANDVMFSTKLGHYIKNFEVSNDAIYCVTRNHGSLTMTVNEKVFDSRLNVYISYYNFLKRNLSKQDFESLNLSGRGYVVNSLGLGRKKVFTVLKVLRKNKIPIIDKKILNPLWSVKRIYDIYNRRRNNKRFQDKTL